MPHFWRRMFILGLLLVVAAVVFLTGIDWGLPSRAVDAFLFDGTEAWTGARVAALAPQRTDDTLGADVDVNPLQTRAQPIGLNATPVQIAEILRRYRLFSYQPDEMITFSALAQMRPSAGKLDPKLYQYGGLWIYPVGAMLKLASMLGVVPLRGDEEFYLDNPSAFGRFYVVARLYTVLWGLAGAWAVFWLTHRATLSLIAAAGATLCYICMPVVVNMSHEAKPHLPGAVLILLAIVAATRFVETGGRRWWIMSATVVGAAAGMVLSAVVAVVILPVMVILRPDTWRRRITIACLGLLVAGAVYCLTNPYVPINLFSNRAVLRSNFANTAAMYEFGRIAEGAVNAVHLMGEGASRGLLIMGTLACVALLVRQVARRRSAAVKSPVGWLIAAVAGAVALQFVALAAGKPGEYGRFALLPDIALGLAASCAAGIFLRRPAARLGAVALLVAFAAVPGAFYLAGFVKDASARPTRLEDAVWLRMLNHAGAYRLGLLAEPAPYSLPPVHLFGWELILLPEGFDLERDPADVHVIVRAVDAPGPNGATAGAFVRQSTITRSDAFPTRISWAAKPFEVWIRPELLDRLEAGRDSGGQFP